MTITSGNLFSGVAPARAEGGEDFTTIVASGAVKIERIVSHGHASPPG